MKYYTTCHECKDSQIIEEEINKCLSMHSKQFNSFSRKELDIIVGYDILNIIAFSYAIADDATKSSIVDILCSKYRLKEMSDVLEGLATISKKLFYFPSSSQLMCRVGERKIAIILYETLFKYCKELIDAIASKRLYSEYLLIINTAYFTALSNMLHCNNECESFMRLHYKVADFEELVERLYEQHRNDIIWDINMDLDALEQMISDSVDNHIFERLFEKDDNYDIDWDEEALTNAIGYMTDIIKSHIAEIGAIKDQSITTEWTLDILENQAGKDLSKKIELNKYPEEISIVPEQTKVIHDNRFEVVVERACWQHCNKIYGPSLKLRVINRDKKTLYGVTAKVIFYNLDERRLWGYDFSTAVSSFGSGLKSGYNTTCFLNSDVGYTNYTSEDNLPCITAQVYINDNFYGGISVDKAYSQDEVENLKLEPQVLKPYTFYRYSEEDFGLFVNDNRWKTNDELYVPYLYISVLNQTLVTQKSVTIKAVFYDHNKLWSETSENVVSSSKKLLPGFKTSAFLFSTVGYQAKISEEKLPILYAEIYVNDILYGHVDIHRCYEYYTRSDLVKKTRKSFKYNTFLPKTAKDYYIVVTNNYWKKTNNLYVPYFKLDITNQKSVSADSISVKVLFLDKTNSLVWAEYKASLVGYGDTPLKIGYKKTAFIESSRGYFNKLKTNILPDITANVYINEEYYGRVTIKKTYDSEIIEEELSLDGLEFENSIYEKRDDRDYYAVVISKHWEDIYRTQSQSAEEALYTPCIQLTVTNQTTQLIKELDIKAVFYDIDNRTLWSVNSVNLISQYSSPLPQGYRKTAFIKSSVGFPSKMEEEKLPVIVAEIYINNIFYGTVTTDRSFEYCGYEIPLQNRRISINNDYIKKNNMDFYPVIRQCCWRKNSNIYGPFLRLDITNQLENAVSTISVKAIFYNENKKEIWCESSYYAVSSEAPLHPGFNVSTFLQGSHGYYSKIALDSLPDIDVDLYINEKYYGSVKIQKDYDSPLIEEPLCESTSDADEKEFETKSWNKRSFLGVMGYSTKESDGYRKKILIQACKDFGKQRVIDHISFLINIRLAQKNGDVKFATAIRTWKKDIMFVREL